MEQKNTCMEYEKVIEYIDGLIQKKELVVGSKLPTERAIAQQLGVGRNSTREALSILHGMGMLERVQGSGNYISANARRSIKQMIQMMISLEMVTKQDVYTFRRTMDKAAGMLLVQKNPDEDVKEKFQKILRLMENNNSEQEAKLDKDFHQMLLVATGNSLLMIIMEAVMDLYRQWIEDVLQRANASDKKKLLQFHRGMYQAILDKDVELLFSEIDGHYDTIERLFGKE